MCSILLSERDVLAYLAKAKRRESDDLSADAKEVLSVLAAAATRPPLRMPFRVFQDTPIFDVGEVRLTAIAPSQGKIGKFLEKIALLTDQLNRDPDVAPCS